MIYRARFILPMDGPPIPWGALRMAGGRIAELGTRETLRAGPGEEVREFPDGVIMPGFVNAHCHLELGMARGMLPRGEAFPMWVSRLRKALEGSQAEQYRQAARLGALECLKNGITTVVDVGNSGEAARALAELPIRSFPYLELIGLDPALAADRLAEGGRWLSGLPEPGGRFRPGVACHAPYSCSPELLRFVAGADGLREGPFTLHLAESAEEDAMFREGRGALLDLCRRFFPALDWPRGRDREGAVRYLSRVGGLPAGSLLAHCNLADAGEARILAATGSSVVHCPRSRAFFGHPGFPYAALREAGVNICLGTDSLASNETLNMFDEMSEFRKAHPEVPARDILAMATRNGAAALALGGELGIIRPGALADFIAIQLRHHPECDLHEEIVGEAHEVTLVVVDGEEVVH
jgi:cytosine/adenosine deaminase-related metal-dependent hydrolase